MLFQQPITRFGNKSGLKICRFVHGLFRCGGAAQLAAFQAKHIPANWIIVSLPSCPVEQNFYQELLQHCPVIIPKFEENIQGYWKRINQTLEQADCLMAGGLHQLDPSLTSRPKTIFINHCTSLPSSTLIDLHQGRHDGDHFVCDSFASAKILQGVNISSEVIYSGIDDRIKSVKGRDYQRKRWKKTDEILIGYIGRHSWEKNPGSLIRAIPYLDSRYHAIYYGSQVVPYRIHPDLIRMADYLARDRVHFYPPANQTGDIYQGLDCLVLTSYAESGPFVLMEAWLAGVPVVSTPVGFVPELEEQYGPLVTTIPIDHNGKELAEAIRTAISRNDIARHAQNVARELFSQQACVGRWESYLNRIAASPSSQHI